MAYIINQALKIIRIILIIALIALGTIDIAKAVIAQKEDEMKRAQTTFVKRIIACIVIFLAPVIVNIFMSLTDYVLEGDKNYTICKLEEIIK